MTIDESYRFTQFVFNKKQNGYIPPVDWNNLAPIMQLSLINDRLGNVKRYRPGDPVPPWGFGLTQKTREELRSISVKPTAVSVSSGLAVIPDDYLYYDTVTAGGKNVIEVTEDEITELNNNSIIPPTTQFPYMVIHSDGIHVYPSSISSINLSYIRQPATPIWNYTIVNDEPVYAVTGGVVGDGNSQDFEVSVGAQLEICCLILQAVGVSLNLQEVLQFASMWEQQGK